MSRNNTQICRCCLKILRNTESRLQTNKKTSDIFKNFIGVSLLPGIICGKCNLNLLSFDAFQREVKRKHDEIGGSVQIKQERPELTSEYFAVPAEEMIEAVLMDEEEMQDANGLVEAVLAMDHMDEPDPVPNQQEQQPEQQHDSESGDEDVIEVPQEPQVPIDLDDISDEPQPKAKAPEEILFKCDHCTAVSKKKEVIVRHIKQSHTFKCEACGKVYPTEERLKAHDQRIHKVVGNRRKQSMTAVRTTEEQMKFRLKTKPYGRPWPSRFAKGEYND
jgi:uncharacterized C2H2 Zn-finger protein